MKLFEATRFAFAVATIGFDGDNNLLDILAIHDDVSSLTDTSWQANLLAREFTNDDELLAGVRDLVCVDYDGYSDSRRILGAVSTMLDGGDIRSKLDGLDSNERRAFLVVVADILATALEAGCAATNADPEDELHRLAILVAKL